MRLEVKPELAMDQPVKKLNEIGYSYNLGGLNNQTFALLGLFCHGFLEKRPVVLPMMQIVDHVSGQHKRVPFRTVFNIDMMLRLAGRHGFILTDRDPSYFDQVQREPERHGLSYFASGTARASEQARGVIKDEAMQSFIFEFFDHLVPLTRIAPSTMRLKHRIFIEKNIKIVAQFRIETDWKAHTDRMKRNEKMPEDLYLPPDQILQKIMRTFPDEKSLFVTCDEEAMPWPKETIASSCKKNFGVDLYWKSDLLPSDELHLFNNLELSLIDLEMAVFSRNFIGITRSTFANMSTFLKFVRDRRQITCDFFYNSGDKFLRQRNDNGGWDHPPWAASPWDHPHYGWPRPETLN